MKINCIGGGPGGLFFSILMKQRFPLSQITVYERNRRGDTFGFGVVFSDETMVNIAEADPESVAAIEAEFRHWSAMDVYYRGRSVTSDGHGFAAISRVRLLDILTERALGLGVKVKFATEVSVDDVRDGADLIVASDGVNSSVRSLHQDVLRPQINHGSARYIWTATEAPFDRFAFIFKDTPHGVVQAHIYPYDETRSTFIVEMADVTWQRLQLGGHDAELTTGESDEHALHWCEDAFADHLGGHGLIGNNSRWLSFPRVTCESWVVDNIVVIGVAAHTAHFSVGSGTKLALEDAIALADAIDSHSRKRCLQGGGQKHRGSLSEALEAFEAERRPAVESLQRAASTSEHWFQQVNRHCRLPFEQFAFSLFTRSMRVTYDNLTERDADYMATVRDWFLASRPKSQQPAISSSNTSSSHTSSSSTKSSNTAPIFYPYELRSVRFHNRVGVSPMAQYSAVNGVPDDWHLVHLGSRAIGGASLVMTEMTCTSPEARITPGCTGIWNDEQSRAWLRITDFVHSRTAAKIGLQVGHAGRKGSTKVPWEGEDLPLDEGNWPLISPSPLRYRHESQIPEAMNAAQMDDVKSDFVAAARRAVVAGFDLLEVHAAHGYLLSSFLSPITNRREDDFGGCLENRARFPLQVIEAVRANWPDDLPLSVRISATDWMPDGFDQQQAIELSWMLKELDVDIIDVSTGQVHPEQQPAYGRLYQTPFAEAIRNTVEIPTMAVGAVSSIDDINTVLLAGRADLCLMARAHLVDPYWTLNAAIDLAQSDQPWPEQYWAGRTSRRREQVADALIERDLR